MAPRPGASGLLTIDQRIVHSWSHTLGLPLPQLVFKKAQLRWVGSAQWCSACPQSQVQSVSPLKKVRFLKKRKKKAQLKPLE